MKEIHEVTITVTNELVVTVEVDNEKTLLDHIEMLEQQGLDWYSFEKYTEPEISISTELYGYNDVNEAPGLEELDQYFCAVE